MRLILRQRPAVPKYVRNVTSRAPAPHRIPVPASAAPRTRAALTDVLLTPVLHPVVRLFVPLVNRHRNRSPVPPPARVLLLLRQILAPVCQVLVQMDVTYIPANARENVLVVN